MNKTKQKLDALRPKMIQRFKRLLKIKPPADAEDGRMCGPEENEEVKK